MLFCRCLRHRRRTRVRTWHSLGRRATAAAHPHPDSQYRHAGLEVKSGGSPIRRPSHRQLGATQRQKSSVNGGSGRIALARSEAERDGRTVGHPHDHHRRNGVHGCCP
eukprot:scaffold322653_cov36-Tisochrysis_lutea.AAC.1